MKTIKKTIQVTSGTNPNKVTLPDEVKVDEEPDPIESNVKVIGVQTELKCTISKAD